MKSDTVDMIDFVPSKQSTLIAENIVREWRRGSLTEAEVPLVQAIAAVFDGTLVNESHHYLEVARRPHFKPASGDQYCSVCTSAWPEDCALRCPYTAALNSAPKWRTVDGTIVYRSYADYCNG